MANINGFPNQPDDPHWNNFKTELLAYLISFLVIGTLLAYNCFIKE